MSASNVDISDSIQSAIYQNDLEKVKLLVESHGLSHCKGWSGGLALLLVALKLKKTEISKFLIGKGAKVNCEMEYLDTPLHLAAEYGFEEVVSLLIQKGALVNKKNYARETPLHQAAKNGFRRCVNVLLQNNAKVDARTNDGSTPLLLAAGEGHSHIVKILLAKGACVNVENEQGDTVLLFAIEWEDSAVLGFIMPLNPKITHKTHEVLKRLLIEDDNNSNKFVNDLMNCGFPVSPEFARDHTVIAAAVKKGYFKIVEKLLDVGADLRNPLYAYGLVHSAIKEKHLDIAEMLLKNGWMVDSKTEDGSSALHVALKTENKDAVCLLLNFEADVNVHSKNGVTPLHIATETNRDDLAKMLLEKKANINACMADGVTPLHIATEKGFRKMVQWLITAGADIDAQTIAEKLTAVHLAVLTGENRSTTIKMLFRNGFDINCLDRRGDSVLDDAFTVTRNEDNDEVIHTIMKYAIRLKVAGLYVREEVLNRVNFNNFLEYQQQCEVEIEAMKEKRLCCHLSLHQILINRKNPVYLKNESVVQQLQDCDFKNYPVYKDLVQNTIRNSERRLELLGTSQKFLNTLIKTSYKLNKKKSLTFPAEILDVILSYVNNSDLTSLCRCVTDLKHQLAL